MAGMIQQIRDCRYARPFVPFKIRTSEGKEFFITDMAHVGTPPGGTRVGVFDDDESFITLTESKIESVERLGHSAS
jgi:hypothetical protein